MKGLSDNEILTGVRNGNHEVFEFMFLLYYRSLCEYAFTLVKNREIAEEIVQEIFVKLWESRLGLNIHTALKPYLYRFVHNRCMNFLDHEAVHRKYAAEIRNNLREAESMISPDYPVANLIQQELGDKINKALDELPDQCKEVFTLIRVEDLSYAETADKLGISLNTVKTQLHRAILKLRKSLEEYFPF